MTLQFTATIGESRYAVSLDRPRDISMPLRFDEPQLRLFGAPPARKAPYAIDGFVGAVRQGGSCNCDVFTLAAHLNGTHTECVGHIARDPVAIHDVLREILIPATLLTVTPTSAADSKEGYDPPLRPHDQLISRAMLEKPLGRSSPAFLDALVIRTIPNDGSKITRDYGQMPPAFFSMAAMEYLVSLGVRHLLTDLPSVDRLDDEGKLTNHHIYWNVPFGNYAKAGDALSFKTITELIYVPDEIIDGEYLLNMQIAPFMADASPSRVFLYELTRR